MNTSRTGKFPGKVDWVYRCLMCQHRGKHAIADQVATDAHGLQWFECKDHEPTDNIAENTRISREEIGAWRARHGIGK